MTIIITLELEAGQAQYFNVLREKHFPAHANYLDAHITLFHKLPSNEPLVVETLRAFANRPPMQLQVEDVRNFGKGVAFHLVSDELKALHKQLQKTFKPWLVRQDLKPLWPHITIQNKVTAFKAQQLHEAMAAEFKPFTVTANAFHTWGFLKGPWKKLEKFPFTTAI